LVLVDLAEFCRENSCADTTHQIQTRNGPSGSDDEIQVSYQTALANVRYLPSSAFLEDREGGVYIPQIHVWQNNVHRFSDDVIFAKEKKSIFQLVALTDSVSEARHVAQQLDHAELEQLSGGLFSSIDTTYIVHGTKDEAFVPDNFVFAMSEEEYDEIGGWPPLKGYDKNRIRKEFPWKKFLVVRPDRYTFGTAQAVDGVQDIARRAKALILDPKST